MLLIAIALQAGAIPPGKPDPSVVVTAPRETPRDQYQRCLATHCPVRDDIAATVRYADDRFLAGQYVDALAVLTRAIGRDRAARTTDPEAMATLYAATTTVALHEGDQDVARQASIGRVDVLRARFGADAPQVLLATIADIDRQAETGSPDRAARRYGEVETRARKAGEMSLVVIAGIRLALINAVAGDRSGAAEQLRGLRAEADIAPTDRAAIDAVLTRIAAMGPRAADHQTNNASARVAGATAPALLWQPSLPPPPRIAHRDEFGVQSGAGWFRTGDWVDIGFDIRRDGSVANAAIIRGNAQHQWALPIIDAVRARRYAATDAPDYALHRTERWSLTADYANPIGSLIPRRTERPHYVQLDLTEGAEPTTADTTR